MQETICEAACFVILISVCVCADDKVQAYAFTILTDNNHHNNNSNDYCYYDDGNKKKNQD